MSSLSYYQQERDRIDEHIAEEKEKEQYESFAKRAMMLYNAFISAGMPEEKAWHFVDMVIQATINGISISRTST